MMIEEQEFEGMTTMPMPELVRGVEHGGDLAAATAAFGTPPDGWLDLSTGINPNAYPMPDLPPRLWSARPDAHALERLCEVARAAYGVAQNAALIATPGAQAAISMLPRIVEPQRKVAVISPTFAEHARAWSMAGHLVREVPHLPRAGDVDIVVLCNPDTPTGRFFDQNELLAMADDLGVGGGMLVVDESNIDPRPRQSLAGDAPHPALAVIRSFGKFYGLAGVRLGFAFGARRLMGRLEAALGPWAVSGPAIAIGTTALGDEAWAKAMGHQIIDQAHRLDKLLTGHGLKVLGGTPLFRLVSLPNALRSRDGLARQGIWTRSFGFAPQWLRLGLPANDAELARLGRALTALAAEDPHAYPGET
ncbi:L-threonine 3-O-phosphate decarboxylase [hydrothermal vent metagenome]|uniref:threonine-phosphate decarboxylase n=1 Tax=hydrothermal vent metagenome TaxID=652676 RepID=A0A3B0TKX5_9ZZZZ